VIAVDHVAVAIDGQAAVGITIVRDACISAVLLHRGDEILEMRATAVLVDVVAIGRVMNRDDGGACARVELGGDERRGAIGAVDHDGDADRCLAVDGNGNVVDGDHILAILAESMRDAGKLAGNTVVATVMANLGFKIAMRKAEITVVETGVGDRYVLEAMRENGYVLGGEQSGHVVLSEYATTGDGLLTALHLLARVAQTGIPLAELAARVEKLPQVLVNVKGVDKSRAETDPVVAEAIAKAEAELGETGRVLLRQSGTEPVIRVMVEAASQEQAQRLTDELAAVVLAQLAL